MSSLYTTVVWARAEIGSGMFFYFIFEHKDGIICEGLFFSQGRITTFVHILYVDQMQSLSFYYWEWVAKLSCKDE
jgi:hypothetical protein